MQRIVIDEPYTFIPPHRGRFWAWLFRFHLRRYLRKTHGLVEIEVRGMERLKESLAAGHGIILTPNHCRPSDPMLMGMLTVLGDVYLYSMASWHVFKQDRLQGFLVPRLGGFSLHREGVDRTSLHFAIDVLERAERPLVIFPEGIISRANDRLLPLLDGVSFVARTAAKRRAKRTPAGKVVVHPVALRYQFLGDVAAALEPALRELEGRLHWRPQTGRPLYERLARLGQGLLALREVEHLGEARQGPLHDRAERLCEHLLGPIEREWLRGAPEPTVPGRVKTLRSAIVPDMAAGTVTAEERARRWRQLEDLYLAQQLYCYPRDYVRPDGPPEHFLETVERFEEDLTDEARVYGPMRVVMQVGDAIGVSPERDRSCEVDPLMREIESRLRGMIRELAREMGGRRRGDAEAEGRGEARECAVTPAT